MAKLPWLFSLLIFVSLKGIAQQSDCYAITVKGSTICNPKLTWGNVKITSSKETLIKFLETNDLLHSCEILLEGRDKLLSKFEKADCPPGVIKIEFEQPKDVLQFYDEIKKEREKKSSAGAKDKASTEGSRPAEGVGEAEVCINSNGEISLSFGNEYGSIQVTSKGKFSIATKNGDKEYKTTF
jgi:hypothetical protein